MTNLLSAALMITVILFSSCKAQTPNTLTAEEKEEGWQLLFDGETTDQWRLYNHDTFPDQGWKVQKGELVFDPYLENGEKVQVGDIITKEKFENFEFKLEWKVQEAGNSGIFYMAIEQPTQPIYWSALEMQILDNENHPDAERGENGNRKAGSLYDLIPADPQNTKPFGEWNQAKIVVDGPKVEHWQNGKKVVEFERWTPGWYEMLRNSKFVDHPEFGDAHSGHIGLQDHGDIVYFRNIKIRELE